MIKQLVTCMLFSFPFLSAANTVIPNERSENLSARTKAAVITSAAEARATLAEKIEEGKESLTAENAFKVLKNTAQCVEEKLDQLSAKKVLLYSICIVAAVKFPFIRQSISALIYPEQIVKNIKRGPKTFLTKVKLLQASRKIEQLKQFQPPTRLARTKDYVFGKPARVLMPASTDFDGLEHEAVMSKAVPGLFSR